MDVLDWVKDEIAAVAQCLGTNNWIFAVYIITKFS